MGQETIKLLLIGCGGFIGAILRYLISGWTQNQSGSIVFPYGTLMVNGLGCFGMGILSQLVATRALFTPEVRLLILTGFFGALTTFSTFGNETLGLIEKGKFGFALLNVALQVILGIGLVWLGQVLATLIWR